jgi:hypothetical protein
MGRYEKGGETAWEADVLPLNYARDAMFGPAALNDVPQKQ